MGKDRAARKLKNMGFPCTFNVPNVGRSGGLVLAWKKEIHLNVISSSLRGIYVTSTDIIHSKTCHIHFVYGEPNSTLRPSFWEQQCQQSNAPIDEPVFVIGDFNTLLGTKDKNGGLEVNDSDFEHLRNFCSVFNLHDPGFSGPRFTWSNMQQGPDLILERLDRCFLNQIVENLCPKFYVNNLPRDSSDHWPMHIGFNYEDTCMPRPFHFMAMWIEDPTIRDITANSWSVNVIGSPAYKLRAKLLSSKKGLRDWNKSSFGNIQTDISTIRKELLDLQISDPTDTTTSARLKARLEYLYTLEELYWKDKSREPHQFQDEILNDLPVKFFVEDNDILNLPLTAEEIKNVVFQMGGKKAPGPDGFTGLFYQKNWDIVGEAIVDMTQTCFRTGHIAKVFSHTNIALIPKVPLADISQNQSAFIPKRSIFDNILLENEAIYSVNHNDKVEGTAAIKLDMSKAYDKLECPTGFFQPERGLRQGDPLSPYLYVICAEALSSYIDNLQRNGTLRGIKKYCLTSGQEINFDKSGILFSRRIPEHRKGLLANILEIQRRDLGEKHLGTPTVFKASKIQTHMGIFQAVDARITIWLHKIISQAARTTLVKHIGQAIPLFQIGDFLIPKHLCRQMDADLCKFWWGETLDPKDRKLHLLGWDILCSPKAEVVWVSEKLK
ncbi:uncharacterized protein LOC113316160 [Papaver somniferum]|uniref:uncharacterized protein LOC113316160 n=1 Tax=Papaver somniferum TaxID=3469 RepID=UPI000E6F99FF|nr:uncharacterized protein LOC113316160 [Papaver somniferum]